MAIDALSIWKTTLENLQPVGDVSWANNFADWIDQRVTNKLIVGKKVSQSTFTFNKSVFAAQLQSLSYTEDALSGITNFANAWENAVLASTMVVPPGTYFESSSPKTTWSTVQSTVIDPASVQIGKLVIISLSAAPVATTAQNSLFPEKFRNAFLSLTVTITGLDSQTPPNGPMPLVLPAASVV